MQNTEASLFWFLIQQQKYFLSFKQEVKQDLLL